MFQSKFAELINDAVMDCIAYGKGKARIIQDGVTIDVEAEWAGNEADIEITIFENCIIRFTFTERVPEDRR